MNSVLISIVMMMMMMFVLPEVCYLSEAPGYHFGGHRCATERVEGVTGLDIMYEDFHNRSMESMEASDFIRSCGLAYSCPDGLEECHTRLVNVQCSQPFQKLTEV